MTVEAENGCRAICTRNLPYNMKAVSHLFANMHTVKEEFENMALEVMTGLGGLSGLSNGGCKPSVFVWADGAADGGEVDRPISCGEISVEIPFEYLKYHTAVVERPGLSADGLGSAQLHV